MVFLFKKKKPPSVLPKISQNRRWRPGSFIVIGVFPGSQPEESMPSVFRRMLNEGRSKCPICCLLPRDEHSRHSSATVTELMYFVHLTYSKTALKQLQGFCLGKWEDHDLAFMKNNEWILLSAVANIVSTILKKRKDTTCKDTERIQLFQMMFQIFNSNNYITYHWMMLWRN